MHPYFNLTAALWVQEERLREAERHRRHRAGRQRAGRQRPTEPRWWHWRGNRGRRKSDHTLAA